MWYGVGIWPYCIFHKAPQLPQNIFLCTPLPPTHPVLPQRVRIGDVVSGAWVRLGAEEEGLPTEITVVDGCNPWQKGAKIGGNGVGVGNKYLNLSGLWILSSIFYKSISFETWTVYSSLFSLSCFLMDAFKNDQFPSKYSSHRFWYLVLSIVGAFQIFCHFHSDFSLGSPLT